MSELVRARRNGPIATLRMNDPDRRNPLSRAMLAALDASLVAAEVDPEVHVVVLSAEGPAFCAGLDLREATEGDMGAATRALIQLQSRILHLSVPVVAQVHGATRAGGLGLLAAADIVIAADDVDFSFPEVRLGVTPAVVSATLLPRLDSRAAAELMLTGRTFPADEAVRIGLLTRSVPRVRLNAEVNSVCAAIASSGNGESVTATKRLLTRPLADALDRDGDALAALSAEFFAHLTTITKE